MSLEGKRKVSIPNVSLKDTKGGYKLIIYLFVPSYYSGYKPSVLIYEICEKPNSLPLPQHNNPDRINHNFQVQQ